MIGFKTELGLRKESRGIALPLAKTSKGQAEVTRLIINPIVKHGLDLLYSVARPGGPPSTPFDPSTLRPFDSAQGRPSTSSGSGQAFDPSTSSGLRLRAGVAQDRLRLRSGQAFDKLRLRTGFDGAQGRRSSGQALSV